VRQCGPHLVGVQERTAAIRGTDSTIYEGDNMTGWLLGGFVVVGALLYAWSRRPERADAVSQAWVNEQIRERGVRRQA